MRKSLLPYIFLFIALLLSACRKKSEDTVLISEKIMDALPFESIDLSTMAFFNEVSENWDIAGGVYVDRSNDRTLITSSGTGVLVNLPEKGKNENIFTAFEHGDIEIELDVMMPLHSNSGIYFQSRYEVQLFDSWGVKEAKHSDIGGIYQRWDDTREKGKEGFEGHPPIINAAKSPGLWQHIKVIFHAPKFDESGAKIKNAWFEEVWLNGVLVQENIEVTGPTRAAAFDDETPLASLMIQGDHGPVAFKNIQYKRYETKAIDLNDLILREYENTSKMFPFLDSLTVADESKTNVISLNVIANNNSQKIFRYDGTMEAPVAGDYLFDMQINGGAALLIDKDTLISMNGNYNRDSLGIGKISLKKGKVPFTLIYNKHTPWVRGFDLYVEGPGIQKYSLQQEIPQTDTNEFQKDFTIQVKDEPIAQRSFWMHEGKKRTHCISVGMPKGINYTYDLAVGSLLQIWGGEFMDATLMWRSRGEKQLGAPIEFIVSIHGDPEFAFLDKDDSNWPDNLIENPDFRQRGYEFDAQGTPSILNQLGNTNINSQFIPSDKNRSIQRIIDIEGDSEIWHKIAEGESIKELPDGTHIIDDESYFVDFSTKDGLKPIIRSIGNKQELLVKIPSGKHNINYNIIW